MTESAAMGDYLGVSKAPKAFATVTLFFALGQTISPVGAGFQSRGNRKLLHGLPGSFIAHGRGGHSGSNPPLSR